MELQIFETDITHDREDFFAFCFFVREARGHVRSQCKKRVRTMSGKCSSVISYFPFIKLEVLNGKPHIQKGVKRITVLIITLSLTAFPFGLLYFVFISRNVFKLVFDNLTIIVKIVLNTKYKKKNNAHQEKLSFYEMSCGKDTPCCYTN